MKTPISDGRQYSIVKTRERGSARCEIRKVTKMQQRFNKLCHGMPFFSRMAVFLLFGVASFQYGIHVLLTPNLRQEVFDLRQHPKTSSHSKIDHAKTYNRCFLTYDGRVWQNYFDQDGIILHGWRKFQKFTLEDALEWLTTWLISLSLPSPWLKKILRIHLWRCSRMTLN